LVLFWGGRGGCQIFLHFGNGEEKEIFFTVNCGGGGNQKILKICQTFESQKLEKKFNEKTLAYIGFFY
jgi:hypothetical protein